MSGQQPGAPAMTGVTRETITLDELAEAFDREIDGCYVGGQEFAVNVFAYVRDHRPSPAPAGPSATATRPAEGREPAPVLCPGCPHDGVLARTLARAEAAEAKLARIAYLCRDKARTLAVEDVRRIIGSEEARDDG